MLQLKRIYDDYNQMDGTRILVDRLWPRGVSKEKAYIDLWLKEIAPSDQLRKWFNHDPKKWEEFQKKYRQELKEKEELLEQLKGLQKKEKTLTFLYRAKDTMYNHESSLLNYSNRLALKNFLGTEQSNLFFG